MPGLRFSLLLTRSSQFPTFGSILYSKYTDPVEQSLVNSMIQLLWDRGEANGYACHMTRNPLPNTPAKTVLLHEAFGDHQVTNVATETEARIIGARLRTPTLDPGRSLGRLPGSSRSALPVEGQRARGLRRRALRPPGCGTTDLPRHAARACHQHSSEVGVDRDKTPLDLDAVTSSPTSSITTAPSCAAATRQACYALGWTGP